MITFIIQISSLMFRLKRLKFILVFLFLVQSIQAQNWPKIYGDSFDGLIKDLSETYDKGFFLTAFIYDYQGIPEYGWIIKTDINGNVLWDKKYGNGSYRNWFSSSFKTMDDGLIISGITNQYSTGDRDPLFIKTNLCGELDWCKVLSCPDQNFGTDVVQVGDGSYIGLLTYYGTGETYARICLVKMDQTGEPVWIQRLAQEDSLINNEEGLYLYLTTNNNYLVSGYAYHPGSYPFWILTDTNGVQIWDLFWDSGYGEAHQVVEKDSGIFYSTSYLIGDNGIQSPVLLKFDRFGNPLDQYALMGDTIQQGGASPINYLNDTTLIIGVAWKEVPFPVDAGFSEVFITDTLGNTLNRRLLLTEYDGPRRITVTSDNKILVSGSYVVDGNWDIYLWKMNADLEDDSIYTQPLTYDSLCPYPILSDTVDLDCSLFVNIDEIPTKEEYESTIKFSPNPARDWIALSLPDIVSSGVVELAIYNIFGQEVMKSSIFLQSRSVSLNVSNLSSGFYLAVCQDAKRKVFSGKFIVAR
jgi:hypothetical protein